jgi:hypothetical protein
MSTTTIDNKAIWSALGSRLNKDNPVFESAVAKACTENLWFTPEHCWQALSYWQTALSKDALIQFASDYTAVDSPKRVGLIMAGNIPLVGLHDLLCVTLMGHTALVKLSSDDKILMQTIIDQLLDIEPQFKSQVEVSEQLPKSIDAVIATGSDTSYRYFEQYFKHVPHLLRKNRKSLAVLDGRESSEQLSALASDIFSYFGLGCRNVSLLFVPQDYDLPHLIDHFEDYAYMKDHNRFANNYTYHKALYLMNQQAHLDNDFILIKEERDLKVPLGCLYVSRYSDTAEVDKFISEHKDDIQCTVGKNYKQSDVDFGQTQSPQLQDFADKVDSMTFLGNL